MEKKIESAQLLQIHNVFIYYHQKFILTIIFFTAVALSTFSTNVFSQTPQQSQSRAVASSGSPMGSYDISEIENIDLFNGGLNFKVPLASLENRGNMLSPDIALRIQTQWVLQEGRSFRYGEPYEITYPELYVPSQQAYNSFAIAPNVFLNNTQQLTTFTYRSPTGESTVLYDIVKDGEPSGNDLAYWNRGTVFVSKDGSMMTFVSDFALHDDCPPPPDGGNGCAGWEDWRSSGYLYFSDGTVSRIQNANILWSRDKHGNKRNIEPPNVGIITLQDNLGRGIEIVNDYLVTPTERESRIISTGGDGNDRIIRILQKKMSNGLLRSDMSIQMTKNLFPINIGTTPPDQVFFQPCGEGNYDPYPFSNSNCVTDLQLPASIILPNNQQYSFQYTSYGRLARVVLPAGGAIEYDWADEMRSGIETGYIPNLNQRLVARRIYDRNGSLIKKTTYSRPLYADSMGRPVSDGYVEVTDYAPNNSILTKSRHYFHWTAPGTVYPSFFSKGGQNAWYYGKEYKTEHYAHDGSTLLSKVESKWEQTAPAWYINSPLNQYCQTIDCSPTNNPRVTEVKKTLADTNLVAKTVYGHDEFLNVTDIYAYDFGTGAPGQLLRRTHTDYVTDPNYTSHTGSHLRGLPSETWISSDATGNNKISKTEFKYDETPLEPRGSNVIGWLDPNNPRRGNLTKERSWLKYGSEPEVWLEARTEYDVLGNIIKTIDARNNSSTIYYDDNFGSPDNEATTNSAPSQLNGKSAFAFATRLVDPMGHTNHIQFNYFTGAVVNTKDINDVISKTIYNDTLDRPTQVVSAVGTFLERQSTTIYDDAAYRIETKSDLNSLNDNLIKNEVLYDGFNKTTEVRRYESDGTYITTKSTPFIVFQDPETLLWRAASRVTNPYRSNETPVWTTSLNDSLGRTVKVITPDNAITKTEYSGNATVISDQAGNKRRSVINALDQLTRVDEPNQNNGNLDNPNTGLPIQSTNYEYDALGNLKKVEQGAQTRTFLYDSLSRLKSATNPEMGTTATNGTISYTYDANGNLMTKRDPRGIKTIYDYDGLNRITKRCYRDIGTSAPLGMKTCENNAETLLPNSPEVSFAYDNLTNAKGRLIQVSNGSSITDYQVFDEMGRVKQSQQTTDGIAYPMMTYKYNLAGALTEQTYPSTRVVKYNLDVDGDLESVQSRKNVNGNFVNYADNFTYTAAKRVSSMRLGNNTWESTVFNTRLQPTQIALGTTQNGVDRLKLNFTYNTNGQNDNNGNVLTQTITTPTTGGTSGFTATQTYIYDKLNRLRSAEETTPGYAGWKQTFRYDRYGNRNFNTDAVGNTTTLSGCPTVQCNPEISGGNNRFTSGQGYTYDSAGNVQSDANGRSFVYDGENKQTKVINGSQTVGEYTYDGEGKRVKKFIPSTGEQTIFVYDASGKLVAEYSNVIESVTTAKRNYLTNDHLGSPRIITDKNGNVVSRRDFMPFGEEITSVHTVQRSANLKYPTPINTDDKVRQKFTSYERDAETELDFAQARMYSSKLGRFNSPDSLLGSGRVESAQTWNRYAYVLNNPLIFVDPTGLYECEGTFEQCRRFGQTLREAEAAMKSYKEGSKEYKALKRAISSYGCNAANPLCGEKGKNGVRVFFGTGQGDGVAPVAGTADTPTAGNPNGQDIRVVFNVNLINDAKGGGTSFAAVIVHEGSHIADGAAWVASGFSKSPTMYQTEEDAYLTQSYYEQQTVYGGKGTEYTFKDATAPGGTVTYRTYDRSWKNLDEDRLRNIRGILNNASVYKDAKIKNLGEKGTKFPNKNYKPSLNP